MDDDRMMTTEQVAEYLVVPVSTIHKWRHFSTGPPAAKIGRHLRFSRRELLEWVEDQKNHPAQPGSGILGA